MSTGSIHSYGSSISLTTISYEGAADALWFSLKNASAQAWLTAQFRLTSQSELDAANATLLRTTFLGRYAPETRDRSTEAYERLCRGRVRQHADLEHYIAEFSEELRHCNPLPPPAAQCQFFINGLTKAIQADCQMDLAGADWAGLPDLMRFARALTRKQADKLHLYHASPAKHPHFPRAQHDLDTDHPGPDTPTAQVPQAQPRGNDQKGAGLEWDRTTRTLKIHRADPSCKWCPLCRGIAEQAGTPKDHRSHDCPWKDMSKNQVSKRLKLWAARNG